MLRLWGRTEKGQYGPKVREEAPLKIREECDSQGQGGGGPEGQGEGGPKVVGGVWPQKSGSPLLAPQAQKDSSPHLDGCTGSSSPPR